MTSLTEAYEARASEVGRERVYLGTGLFGAGALLLVLGIVTGATGLLLGYGFSVYEAREIAGTLAGVGIPAVFVGVFAVLPTGRSQRAAAAIGASVTVLGVVLFRQIYPDRWFVESAYGVPTTETLFVVAVYFLGIIVTAWYLFVAVATFKIRNDPGGTVSLQVTESGETRLVETEPQEPTPVSTSGGGVGIIGNVDRQAVESHISDGGATTRDITSPMDEESDRSSPGTPDRYCGNCTHFDYVRTDRGIQPYCGLHDDVMDDMSACGDWQQNNR